MSCSRSIDRTTRWKVFRNRVFPFSHQCPSTAEAWKSGARMVSGVRFRRAAVRVSAPMPLSLGRIQRRPAGRIRCRSDQAPAVPPESLLPGSFRILRPFPDRISRRPAAGADGDGAPIPPSALPCAPPQSFRAPSSKPAHQLPPPLHDRPPHDIHRVPLSLPSLPGSEATRRPNPVSSSFKARTPANASTACRPSSSPRRSCRSASRSKHHERQAMSPPTFQQEIEMVRARPVRNPIRIRIHRLHQHVAVADAARVNLRIAERERGRRLRNGAGALPAVSPCAHTR